MTHLLAELLLLDFNRSTHHPPTGGTFLKSDPDSLSQDSTRSLKKAGILQRIKHAFRGADGLRAHMIFYIG